MCPVTNWCSAPADPPLILQTPPDPTALFVQNGEEGTGARRRLGRIPRLVGKLWGGTGAVTAGPERYFPRCTCCRHQKASFVTEMEAPRSASQSVSHPRRRTAPKLPVLPQNANGKRGSGHGLARLAIPAPREASDEPQEISAPDLGAGKSSCQTWG